MTIRALTARWPALALLVALQAALVGAGSCDTPAIAAPIVPDCTGTFAPIPGEAYCPTTLAPFIYHWNVGRDIAIYVDTSHSQADADIVGGVRDGIAAWEAIGLLGDIHMHMVGDKHSADVVVRFNTAPSLVASATCQIIDFGAGGNTFFCVADADAPADEPLTFVDGTPGHVKMLVTMNRVKFLSADQFHSAVAHELGHVLGIGAHSSSQTDLMFGIPLVSKPSNSDAQTLRYVLSLKPDVRF